MDKIEVYNWLIGYNKLITILNKHVSKYKFKDAIYTLSELMEIVDQELEI